MTYDEVTEVLSVKNTRKANLRCQPVAVLTDGADDVDDLGSAILGQYELAVVVHHADVMVSAIDRWSWVATHGHLDTDMGFVDFFAIDRTGHEDTMGSGDPTTTFHDEARRIFHWPEGLAKHLCRLLGECREVEVRVRRVVGNSHATADIDELHVEAFLEKFESDIGHHLHSCNEMSVVAVTRSDHCVNAEFFDTHIIEQLVGVQDLFDLDAVLGRLRLADDSIVFTQRSRVDAHAHLLRESVLAKIRMRDEGAIVQIDDRPSFCIGHLELMARGVVGSEHDLIGHRSDSASQDQLRFRAAVEAATFLVEDLQNISPRQGLGGVVVLEVDEAGFLHGSIHVPDLFANTDFIDDVHGCTILHCQNWQVGEKPLLKGLRHCFHGRFLVWVEKGHSYPD